MKDDALTKFLELAEDHYWDTLESHQGIVMAHIYQIAMNVRKSLDDTVQANNKNEADAKIDAPKRSLAGYTCSECGYFWG